MRDSKNFGGSEMVVGVPLNNSLRPAAAVDGGGVAFARDA